MNTIYISGPISGRPDNNRRAFADAQIILQSHGFKVINPLDIDLPEKANGKPYDWSDHMRLDIKALMDCNLVAVLPDWYLSKGSCLEIELALRLGIEVLRIPDLMPVPRTEIAVHIDYARSTSVLEQLIRP